MSSYFIKTFPFSSNMSEDFILDCSTRPDMTWPIARSALKSRSL